MKPQESSPLVRRTLAKAKRIAERSAPQRTPRSKKRTSAAADPLEIVHLRETRTLPKDYHCRCKFCKEYFTGILERPDGSKYSKLDRRSYYSDKEKGEEGHLAKTPLHIARWAVQQYTKPGDWVFDPTVGAGTTMMEALTHARNAMGIEIQYIDVLRANLETPAAKASAVMAIAVHGDARQTDEHLAKFMIRPRLVVNNPPYFGDQIQTGFSSRGGKVLLYSEKYRNLAFLKEGPEYFKIMGEIYRACSDRMPKGGHLVLGIKDQMRNRKPDGLHTKLIETVHAACPGLRLKTIVLLPHHPTTLFMHTYPKRFGVPVPVYQTIMSFVKR